MTTWRAGCGESRTSGSEGGPGKPTSREADRAPRSDPYTEHRTAEGKLYMCAVKDVYSNRIVGYSIDSRMKSRLAVAALESAVARRAAHGAEVAGCVVHSDRGSQGGFNWSSQHPLMSEVFTDGDGGLEQEDQRCSRGCASAVAC